jgi:hypothetical protein
MNAPKITRVGDVELNRQISLAASKIDDLLGKKVCYSLEHGKTFLIN